MKIIKRFGELNVKMYRFEDCRILSLNKLKPIFKTKIGEFNDFTNIIFLGQGDVVKDLQKARLECENLKRQMLQQEINFNIQKTEALTR